MKAHASLVLVHILIPTKVSTKLFRQQVWDEFSGILENLLTRIHIFFLRGTYNHIGSTFEDPLYSVLSQCLFQVEFLQSMLKFFRQYLGPTLLTDILKTMFKNFMETYQLKFAQKALFYMWKVLKTENCRMPSTILLSSLFVIQVFYMNILDKQSTASKYHFQKMENPCTVGTV